MTPARMGTFTRLDFLSRCDNDPQPTTETRPRTMEAVVRKSTRVMRGSTGTAGQNDGRGEESSVQAYAAETTITQRITGSAEKDYEQT